MKFTSTAIHGAWVLEIDPRRDARGLFARTMCREEFAQHGLICDFVQQNLSVSTKAGTVRGLHFQRPPYGEAKLVRCTRGAMQDVFVDMRKGSPTYLRHETIELTADSRRQLYIPQGIAQGFQTLVDDTEISYLVSSPYAATAEGGFHYADPAFGLSWPLPVSSLSEKDAGWAPFDPNAPPLFD